MAVECTYSRRRKGAGEFVPPLDVKSHYSRDLCVSRQKCQGKIQIFDCVSSIHGPISRLKRILARNRANNSVYPI